MRRIAVVVALLALTACTSSDVITVATAAVSGEIAFATADGFTDGVVYGNVALDALSCSATEAASADSTAIKSAKVGECVALAVAAAPIGAPAEQAIVAAITAALKSVLAAYGIAPASPALGAARTRHVALHEGRPGYFERQALLNAAQNALAAKRPVPAIKSR